MRGSDLTEREAQPFTINSLLEPPRRRNDPDASSDFISVDRWAAKAEASAAVGGCWAPWLRPSGPRPAAIVSGLLRRNYRSSKALLALPSALFYGGHLVVWAEQEPLQPPAWDLGASVRVSEAGVASGLRMIRPRSSFVFCGVRGRQMRPADVPSFYNVEESEALCALVTGLLETGTYADGSRVLVEDIGVLAPYRKQVQRIRTKLREVGLAAVRVGTVDDFQGQVTNDDFACMPATAAGP